MMQKLMNAKSLIALLAGLLFGLGLVLAGMTQPAVIIGFLNISQAFEGEFPGKWNPSLVYLMAGALVVAFISFSLTLKPGNKPWLADKFELPVWQDIDRNLVVGALIFGIGWPLAGYCPGPAFAALFAGGTNVFIFTAAMLVGMFVASQYVKHSQQS